MSTLDPRGNVPATPTPTPTSIGGTAAGGGSLDTIGNIPVMPTPAGQMQIVRDGKTAFRAVIDRFEGVNLKQSPMEIGELQAVEMKNLLTDEATLRKRAGSVVVSGGSTGYVIGLREVAGPRILVLHNCDDATGWTPSDAVNFTVTLDTAVKTEGSGSLRLDASGAGAAGDTVIYDFGAGATKDLTKFDAVEVVMRTSSQASGDVAFGVSEDNTTYTEASFTNSGTPFDNWVTVRVVISSLAASARDAIRYLRFRCSAAPTGAKAFWADSIRATRYSHHLLQVRRAGSIGTGGGRDAPGSLAEINVESNESGAWVGIATTNPVPASTRFSAVDWLGNTYCAVGAGGMFKIVNGVGTVWTEPPPSRFIELHYEKLWAFSQVFDLNGLRHTDTNSSTSWPTVAAPTGGNGGTMYVGRGYAYLPTGMKSAFGNLYLWTEGDLWILFGTDNSNFNLQRAHPGAGTLSHESIARMDNGMIWHDGLGDRILWLMGTEAVDISDNIRPVLQAIPAAMKPWTAGFFDGRDYIFSYCRAGQTTNDRCMIFDTMLRRWHGPFEGDWVGFNAGLLGVDGKRYVGAGNNLGVRQILTGADDAGAAIALAWKSGATNFRLPSFMKRIRRLWVRCSSTTATLTVSFYRDLEVSPVRSYNLTFTGLPTEVQRTGVDADVRADVLQIGIAESSGNPVCINELGCDGFLVRALR